MHRSASGSIVGGSINRDEQAKIVPNGFSSRMLRAASKNLLRLLLEKHYTVGFSCQSFRRRSRQGLPPPSSSLPSRGIHFCLIDIRYFRHSRIALPPLLFPPQYCGKFLREPSSQFRPYFFPGFHLPDLRSSENFGGSIFLNFCVAHDSAIYTERYSRIYLKLRFRDCSLRLNFVDGFKNDVLSLAASAHYSNSF